MAENSHHMAAGAALKLTILTPQGAGVSEISVSEVIVPAEYGLMGIRAGHAPLIALLKSGEVRYTPLGKLSAEGKEGKEFAAGMESFGIYRGLAEVLDNKVLILALGEGLADKLELEKYLQAARHKHSAAIIRGDDMDLDEAGAMIKRSIAVLNNLRKNARKHGQKN